MKYLLASSTPTFYLSLFEDVLYETNRLSAGEMKQAL